jgi:hypothetical protein
VSTDREDNIMQTARRMGELVDEARAPRKSDVRCIFCGGECGVDNDSHDGHHWVVCYNTACLVSGPYAESREDAIDRFYEPTMGLGDTFHAPIGDAIVEIQSGPLTPGVSSFFVMDAKRTVLNKHATPGQLRALAALCLRRANEAEWAAKEVES